MLSQLPKTIKMALKSTEEERQCSPTRPNDNPGLFQLYQPPSTLPPLFLTHHPILSSEAQNRDTVDNPAYSTYSDVESNT